MASDEVGLLRLLVALVMLAIAVIGIAYAEKRGWFAKFLATIAVFGSLIAISLVVAVFAKELDLITQPTLEVTRGLSPSQTAEATRTVTATQEATLFNVCAGVPAADIRQFPKAEHQVARGETLSKIAAKYGTSVGAIRDANKEIHPELYDHPDCLRSGIWLILPNLE